MCSYLTFLQIFVKEQKEKEELEQKLEMEKLKKEIENKRLKEISKFKLLVQPEPTNDKDVCFILYLISKICFFILTLNTSW